MSKGPSVHVNSMVGIFKGATINLFGMAGHMLLAFGYSVFLARVLDPSELGRFFLGFTVLNFLIIVALLGLDFAIWRFVALFVGEGDLARARGVIRSSLFMTVPASIVVAVAWYLSKDWVGGAVFRDVELGPVFQMFALALPFMVLARILNASTQGMRKMHYQVISKDLVEQLVKFIASISLLSLGLMGILMANVLAAAASMVLALWFLQKSLPVFGRKMTAKHEFCLVSSYSFPLIFSTILAFLLVWVDTLLLGYFKGASDVGLYGVCSRIAILGTLVLTSFSTMFSPVISDLYHRKDMAQLAILHKFVTKWVFTISLPVFMLIVLFSDKALEIFGNPYKAAASALILLALGQFVNAATGPVSGLVLMTGRSYLDLINNLLAVIINVSLCILLIPWWGILGAAAANSVATATINVVRAFQVFKLLGVHGYDRTFIKPVTAGAASALVAYGIFLLQGSTWQWLFLLLSLAFILVYLLSLYFLGFEDDDKAMVRLVRERLAATKSA